MDCHKSFSDSLWCMTEQVQFGRTYCTFPLGKSIIVYNNVPALNE